MLPIVTRNVPYVAGPLIQYSLYSLRLHTAGTLLAYSTRRVGRYLAKA